MPKTTLKTADKIRERMEFIHSLSELIQFGQFPGGRALQIKACMDQIQSDFDRLQKRLARALEAQKQITAGTFAGTGAVSE